MMNIAIIFLLIILSLEVSSQDTRSLTLEKDCTDELENVLRDYIENNQEYIAKLYDLTTLKIAVNIREDHQETLESLIQRKHNSISEYFLNQRETLERIYNRYGISTDYETLLENYTQANYWRGNLRLSNEDISAYILAQIQSNSRYTQTDAAVVWLVNQVAQSFPRGTLEYNSLSLSPRVARYTGIIENAGNYSRSEILEKLEEVSADLQKQTAEILSIYSEKASDQCLDWLNHILNCYDRDFLSTPLMQNFILKLIDDSREINLNILRGEFQVLIDEDFSFTLSNLPSFHESERVIEDVPIRQRLEVELQINRRRELTQGFMEIVEQKDRLIYFEQISSSANHDQVFGIIDKENLDLSFYYRSGDIIESFSLQELENNSDQRQYGGAGLYSYAYTSPLGGIFLSDHTGQNVRYELSEQSHHSRAQDLLENAEIIYILPIDEQNYFRLKDDRLIFTTRNRNHRSREYNLTPRRREYRPLLTIITNPAYRNPDSIAFIETLDAEKKTLMEIYNLENDDYNDLVRIAFGIMGNESQFGQSPKYLLKERIPYIISLIKGEGFDTSSNSRGPTQIKRVPRLIEEHYGITKETLQNPRHAAIATLGFLAEILEELKIRERNHPDITPENRLNYLHYLYIGRHDHVSRGTGIPERNIYFRQIQEFSLGLVQLEQY